MADNNDPYKWTKKHTQLNQVLVTLAPFPNDIRFYVTTSGLDPAAVNWDGNAYNIWNSAIREAINQRMVNNLITAVSERFPKNPFLLAALRDEIVDYSISPEMDKDIPWKGTDETTLEVLTQQDVNTLLPISFLEMGLLKAKSVAKVLIARPGRITVGSGFVTADNIFITNHHVIPDKETATGAKVIFNYEDGPDGVPRNVTSFDLDPARMVTSPVNEYDTTAIRILGDANSRFGEIALKPPAIAIDKNQFVNIIQHPAGEPKKIALYHNIVTKATDREVQYLTDTLKGSSGSPVFNSDWELVALHHAGGDFRNQEPVKNVSAFRNEGINILRVIEIVEKGRKEGKL